MREIRTSYSLIFFTRFVINPHSIYQELRACQLILEKQIEDRAFEGEGPNHTNHLRGAMCVRISFTF